jgi:hypothetical protein
MRSNDESRRSSEAVRRKTLVFEGSNDPDTVATAVVRVMIVGRPEDRWSLKRATPP